MNLYSKLISLLVLLLTMTLSISCQRSGGNKAILNDYGGFGGDFTLTDQDGKPFTMSSLKGKIVLLFFGYTHCPDYCPSTLLKIKQASQLLGAASKNIQVVFVTVDNERDKPAKLKEYLKSYDLDPPIIGLTGTPEETKKVFTSYGIYHKKDIMTASKMGYTMSHTTTVFMFDKQNKMRYTFSYHQKPEEMAKILKLVL